MSQSANEFNSNRACFNPYLLITSFLQFTFGKMRRKEMDINFDQNKQFILEMQKLKNEFQSEQEARNHAAIRAKMQMARKYRAEEKYELFKLNDLKKEVERFINNYLPIDSSCLSTLLATAKQYKELGYNSDCPINILLFRTESKRLNFDRIANKLDKTASEIGNIIFRNWCTQDIVGNSAIYNLHAAMSNIPTVVISPYIHCNSIHFSVSMWEAQSEEWPMIRPLFTLPLNQKLMETNEGRIQIEDILFQVSTLISGCARDSYMLLTQGLSPTLPNYLEHHPEVASCLLKDEYKDIRSYLSEEYRYASINLSRISESSSLLSKDEMLTLSGIASTAADKISMLSLNR